MRNVVFAKGKANVDWPAEATGAFRKSHDDMTIVFIKKEAGWPVKAYRWVEPIGLFEISNDDATAAATLYGNHAGRLILDTKDETLRAQRQAEVDRLPADAQAVYNTFRWEWINTPKQR